MKAYKDLEFINSRSARPIRILSEYLEPQSRFEHYNVADTVVFFGSARARSSEAAREMLTIAERDGDAAKIEHARRHVKLSRYYDDARELARLMTDWSKELQLPDRRFIVCTGGGPGIMEAANRGASDARGVSIGLGISLPFEATANPYITRELAFEFHYFFMRKFWFVYLAKALIIFPGGFGTLDELFELLTLVQTQKMGRRVPIVLYGEDFWSDLINFETMVEWGTISAEDVNLFHRTSSVESAFEYLKTELTRKYLQPS